MIDHRDDQSQIGARRAAEVFEPLRNAEYFKSFRLHPELLTVVWPNGADFAPEFLRATLRIAA
ncbi:MAG: hypothetical protein COS34_10690 [Lysobacterales bacterium CG02_land_8_20_14_3_00_62_12]|nr:MAG: hypothetical protein COS34_10690 [Xanthomonadales bacterium CG02_land_8_20_14_3_00_62_12]